MEAVQVIRTGEPDEIREFERGRLEVYRLGGLELGRACYEPGWRWSEHVRPLADTELCEVSHVGLVLAGSVAVSMSDGTEFVLVPGDFFAIAPGHDSWVVGDEPYISLHIAGAASYAASEQSQPDLEGASELMRLIGLRFNELTPTRVAGHFTADAAHHQPWGLVHAGALATAIETAATTGGYLAVREKGLTPVGISNSSHFLRPHRAGELSVDAKAVHQGRLTQLWTVEITRAEDRAPVASGQVRLQNMPSAEEH